MRHRPARVLASALAALALALAGAPLASAAAAAKPAKSAPAPQGRAEILPWIADDYEGALAIARQRRIPIFIESWAPW